jgi:hypothetical protein
MSRVDELPADQRPARIEATVIRIPLLERCESTKEISDRMAIALQKREPFQKLVVRSSQADSKRRELELSLLEGFATCLHVLGF